MADLVGRLIKLQKKLDLSNYPQDSFFPIKVGYYLGLIPHDRYCQFVKRKVEESVSWTQEQIHIIAEDLGYLATDDYASLRETADRKVKMLQPVLGEDTSFFPSAPDKDAKYLEIKKEYLSNKLLISYIDARTIFLKQLSKIGERISFTQRQSQYNRLLRH